MMGHLKFVPIVFFVMIAACQDEKKNDEPLFHADDITFIDYAEIRRDEINLSELYNKFQFIPLIEVSDTTSALGTITKLIESHDRLFVLDNEYANAMHVYDLAGNFIYSITCCGKGPNEILTFNDFSIGDSTIYILDNGNRSLKLYNVSDGDFIRSISLKNTFEGVVKFGEESLLLKNAAIDARETNHSVFLLYNLQTGAFEEVNSPLSYFEYEVYIHNEFPFVLSGEKLFHTNYFSSDMVSIDKNFKRYHKIQLDFGDKGLSKVQDKIKSFTDFGKYSRNTSHLTGLKASSDHDVYFMVSNEGRLEVFHIDVLNNKFSAYGEIKNDLYELPITYFIGSGSESSIYTALPIEMLESFRRGGFESKSLEQKLSSFDMNSTNLVLIKLSK